MSPRSMCTIFQLLYIPAQSRQWNYEHDRSPQIKCQQIETGDNHRENLHLNINRSKFKVERFINNPKQRQEEVTAQKKASTRTHAEQLTPAVS